MDAVISYHLVFLCALLVSLGVIYAYQRGKQAGKLESEQAKEEEKEKDAEKEKPVEKLEDKQSKDIQEEKPTEPVIYIQFGQAQNELWQTLYQWGSA